MGSTAIACRRSRLAKTSASPPARSVTIPAVGRDAYHRADVPAQGPAGEIGAPCQPPARASPTARGECGPVRSLPLTDTVCGPSRPPPSPPGASENGGTAPSADGTPHGHRATPPAVPSPLGRRPRAVDRPGRHLHIHRRAPPRRGPPCPGDGRPAPAPPRHGGRPPAPASEPATAAAPSGDGRRRGGDSPARAAGPGRTPHHRRATHRRWRRGRCADGRTARHVRPPTTTSSTLPGSARGTQSGSGRPAPPSGRLAHHDLAAPDQADARRNPGRRTDSAPSPGRRARPPGQHGRRPWIAALASRKPPSGAAGARPGAANVRPTPRTRASRRRRHDDHGLSQWSAARAQAVEEVVRNAVTVGRAGATRPRRKMPASAA